MKKITVLTLALILALSLFAGCGSSTPVETQPEAQVPHTFGDLTLTLPESFEDLSKEDYAKEYTFLFGSKKFSVLGVEGDKKDFLEKIPDGSLKYYTELMVSLNELGCEVTEKDGLYTFSYDAKVDETEYSYIAASYETEDTYWVLQAYCPKSGFEANRDVMWDTLKAVEVK